MDVPVGPIHHMVPFHSVLHKTRQHERFIDAAPSQTQQLQVGGGTGETASVFVVGHLQKAGNPRQTFGAMV